MGLEVDFTCILRDFVQFLEALNEVKLSPSLESIRENLLHRSKATLLNLAIGPPSSPEPYLDMNAGKGILLATNKDVELQEYINADQDSEPKINQDYYETFQEINNSKSEHFHSIENEEDSLANTLTTIYSSFSATQTRINCNKWGQLSRKIEKKIPFIDPLRVCWVGLLGSYLLIYGNEKDSRPNAVVPIRGYRGRPAPSVDSKRSDSAFEIFCPGHKTLQFVAKSPEEMEEWVAIICETSTRENDNKTRLRESSLLEITQLEQKDRKNSESSVIEERYQDADFRPSRSKENLLCLPSIRIQPADKETNNEILLREKPTKLLSTKDEVDENETPPLPARIPRRLPSLPHEDVLPSFQPVDEPYDEDDIYHKIEDFRDGTGYQNFMVAKKEEDRKIKELKKNGYLDTYDDVAAETPENKKKETQETYDDVQSAPQKSFSENETVDSPESYDDVKTIAVEMPKSEPETKEKKLSGAAQIKASKKSFLDRMRNRSYIVKKENKKKRSSSPASSVSSEALPTYDDIAGMINHSEQKSSDVVEQCEYLCPPTPRPIYSIPPSVTSSLVEQLYDDIASCQEKFTKETENTKNHSSNLSLNRRSTETDISKINLDIKASQLEMNNDNEHSQMEFEYYQSPKSNRVLQVEDALYDDVALLMKFRSKPRESTVSNFEKVWSRFSSGRSKTSVNEPEESANLSTCPNDNGETRVNRFQKLVNKIENTLGKSSMKPLPLSNSKSHSSSSVT